MFLRLKIQEVMLRERSRAVGSRHGLMSDATSLSSPTTASLLSSPRLVDAISAKGHADCEGVVSPTSTLEAEHFSTRGNHFISDRSARKPPLLESTPAHSNEINGEPRAVGLGLLDALTNEDSNKMTSEENKMVVVGLQLKIRVPPVTPCSNFPTGYLESPHSPIEFGIKTKNSLLALNSPAVRCGNLDSCIEASSPQDLMRNMSPSEMELSEDYTCVILHGPNPRTIHIFDNCIIESSGDGCINGFMNEKICSNERYSESDGDELVSFCSACKKKLGHHDIFMNRGEKAFCSHECSCQEMLFDAVEKC